MPDEDRGEPLGLSLGRRAAWREPGAGQGRGWAGCEAEELASGLVEEPGEMEGVGGQVVGGLDGAADRGQREGGDGPEEVEGSVGCTVDREGGVDYEKGAGMGPDERLERDAQGGGVELPDCVGGGGGEGRVAGGIAGGQGRVGMAGDGGGGGRVGGGRGQGRGRAGVRGLHGCEGDGGQRALGWDGRELEGRCRQAGRRCEDGSERPGERRWGGVSPRGCGHDLD